ncbi:MAG: hypothetical protein Q9161_000556 [Pseudevernia consocians]
MVKDWKLPSQWRLGSWDVYIISAISIVGGGLFGFDVSSMSAIIGTPQYKCYCNQVSTPTTSADCFGSQVQHQGGITASLSGGSRLDAWFSGFLSDMFDRKTSIMICSYTWVVSSVFVCASWNIGVLIVGRFINELCVVGAQQWAITWGIMIMFYISYGCSKINGTAAFRIPQGLQMIPAILLFIGMCFLPEPPRWLARKDRWGDCHAVLTLVHGKSDPNSPFVI